MTQADVAVSLRSLMVKASEFHQVQFFERVMMPAIR
jgi:hypothetical protein